VPWDDQQTERISVEVKQLDDFIKSEQVLYLKIDAQGYDPEVLFGARKAIEEQRISYINFEVSPGLAKDSRKYVDVIHWLAKSGYSCFDCKFFKQQDMRGKSENILKMTVENFVSTLDDTVMLQRGVNVKKYTDILCTVF